MSCRSFQIKFNWKKSFHPVLLFLDLLPTLDIADDGSEGETEQDHSRLFYSSAVLLSFEMDELRVSSPNIDFNFFIGSSKISRTYTSSVLAAAASTEEKSAYRLTFERILKRAVHFVDIKLRYFHFDWNMPFFEKSRIEGGCTAMHIYFPHGKMRHQTIQSSRSSSTNPLDNAPPNTNIISKECVRAVNDVKAWQMKVTQCGEQAMLHNSDHVVLSAELHLPSGGIDADLALIGLQVTNFFYF